MGKVHLTIADCMSPSPYSIHPDQPMSDAHELMREHQIRHLPVMKGERLVGMLSLRDLHLMETLQDVDPTEVKVSEAMTDDPYAVDIGTGLREIALNMGAHKYGSAVVIEGGKVVGVFTTVDAMRVLANLL
jgi:acetoin utilization protein AcuB